MTQVPTSENDATIATQAPRVVHWAGWLVSALPVLMLLMSATMKFLQPAGMQEQLGKLGWAQERMLLLGVVELVSTLLYVLPQTSVLGAILLTGYLGGAIATHVRVNDLFVVPLLLGVMLWVGLLLREPRLWPLLPWRRRI